MLEHAMRMLEKMTEVHLVGAARRDGFHTCDIVDFIKLHLRATS